MPARAVLLSGWMPVSANPRKLISIRLPVDEIGNGGPLVRVGKPAWLNGSVPHHDCGWAAASLALA
jgi:hypothetical protein